MENQLTSGSVWKKLILFAIPVFGANLLQALYGTVDLIIVGQFASKAAVSAVSTGSMTMQTITGVVIGLTMGCTVLLGQNIGKEDYKASSRTIGSSVALFVITGIVLSILIFLFALPISNLMNAPEEALQATASYIRICGMGSICIVLFNFISGMFRGIGNSKTPLVLMAIACVGNIIGDLILVGLFHMGASGAALATVLAQLLSVISAILIIKKIGFGFEVVKEELRVAKKETLLVLKYGLPIAAQELLTGISFMVILAILNTFGLVASAGVGIAEKICGLMFIVPGAIMSAVSVFSAQNVGAGKLDRAKESMFAGMLITFVVGLCMFAISFFQGVQISGFFSNDLDVCLASADYLKSYSIDCIIVGFNFCMMGYLNGLGRTGFVALQGILSTFLVRIPVSYFMSKIAGVTLFQIGFATPMATVFAIAITVIYLKRIQKQKKIV